MTPPLAVEPADLPADRCGNCGAPQVPEAAFCHRCGTAGDAAPAAVNYEQAVPESGYEYVSPHTLFGLPLVHVCNDRRTPDGKRKVARGVIAIGDVAFGLLFAHGGVAVGGIAFGGAAVGLVSFGGLSLGLLAAAGGLAIGGLGAFGGAAVTLGIAAGGFAVGSIRYGGGGLDLTPWTGIG